MIKRIKEQIFLLNKWSKWLDYVTVLVYLLVILLLVVFIFIFKFHSKEISYVKIEYAFYSPMDSVYESKELFCVEQKKLINFNSKFTGEQKNIGSNYEISPQNQNGCIVSETFVASNWINKIKINDVKKIYIVDKMDRVIDSTICSVFFISPEAYRIGGKDFYMVKFSSPSYNDGEVKMFDKKFERGYIVLEDSKVGIIDVLF